MPHTHQLEFDGDVVRKRFVSWSNGEADREWAGLSLLNRHVPGLAPRPLSRETIDGAPVIVMSRVPGAPLGGARLSPGAGVPLLSASQIDGFGTSLRQLFQVPIEPGLPARAWGPSAMRDRIQGSIADTYDRSACRDPDLVQEALTTVRAWLGRGTPSLDRIVDPVITRGDGNLDNVLWDGTRCRLVDFEEFGVSDIAYEVAEVLEHVSSRLQRYLPPEALTTAVGLTAEQRHRLAAYQALLASFWLVLLLPGNRGFHRNPPGSTEDQATHVLALLQA